MSLLQPLAEHLKINKPLPWNVLDANGTLLLSKGYVIDDERQIKALLARGLYVDEDEFKEYLRHQPEKNPFDPFWEWEEIYLEVGTILRDHEKMTDFPARTAKVCARIDEMIDHDADVGIFVMTQIDVTRYPVAHSLQTAFVCALLARRLELSVEDRSPLMKAALTMNIAMLELQSMLFQQSEPLTAEQRAQINEHPLRGRERLEKLGVRDEKWLRAVAEHHEKRDGSGYPNRITDVLLLAEILHYTDIYCALVSPRAYRKGLLPQQAARSLYLSCTDSNSTIGALIIKEIGLYPPGYFVKLANGDLAVVVRRGRQANTPHVCSLVTGSGLTCLEPLRRDTSLPDFAIVSSAPAEDILVQVRPAKLFGYRV